MNVEQIRGLSDQDLQTEKAKVSEQLFRIRFQKSLGSQEGIKNIRALKLDIARLETIRRERALEGEHQASPAPKASAPAPSRRTERKKAKRS